MSAEVALYTALSALVAGRVYPDVAPLDAAVPRIVVQQVGGVEEIYAEAVVMEKENGRYQVACWAETRLEAVVLAQQARAAIVAAAGLQSEPIGARVSTHEPDTGLYGTRQDFSVWSPV